MGGAATAVVSAYTVRMDPSTAVAHLADPFAARITALAGACVKCGLCLPHCPTYRIAENESESPRGRIALATLTDPDADVLAHLDHCLACGACERACPSDVRYLDLLQAARSRDGAAGRASLRRRSLHWLLARPRLLLRLSRLARLLPGRWRRRLIPDLGLLPPPATVLTDAVGDPDRPRLLLLPGCTGSTLESALLRASQNLLTAAGYRVSLGADQCCGALAAHSGSPRLADALGAHLQQDLRRRAEPHCTALVSGCAPRYRELCSGPGLPGYRDPLVLLAERAPRLRFARSTAAVALHLPCTQQWDADAVAATRQLLAAIPGLHVIELPTRGHCCGAAGSWSVDHPDLAGRLLAPLLQAVRASGADQLISANIGCRLQFSRALSLPVLHPLEFLSAQLDPN